MKKELGRVVIVLLVLLLFVGCLPFQKPLAETLEEPGEEQEQTASSVPVPSPLDVGYSEAIPLVKDTGRSLSIALIKLFNKNKDAINYYYLFDAYDPQGYEVYRIGNKVKKVYSDTRKLRNEVYYNKVYIDLARRRAIGICDKAGVTCGPIWKKAFLVDFELEGKLHPSPVELINQPEVRYAKAIGSEFFDRRQTTILEYINAEGKREQLSVDNYYGLPLKQVLFESQDPFAAIEQKHTFTKLLVGQVLPEDVTLPPDYTLVE